MNRRQKDLRIRLAGDYMLQRASGALSGFAVIMHYPLIALVENKLLLLLCVIPLVVLAVALNIGVQGLVAGTADHRVRRSVRRGTRVAWLLSSLAPLSLLAAILNGDLLGRVMWVLVIILGVAVLVAYIRGAKKYWSYVQSVA